MNFESVTLVNSNNEKVKKEREAKKLKKQNQKDCLNKKTAKSHYFLNPNWK